MREKFLKYYNLYKGKIFTHIYYRVNFNRALAEDLVSEIFIKAYENFDKFEEDRSENAFSKWIFTITHNHLANHYRDSKSRVDLDEVDNYVSQNGEEEIINDLENSLLYGEVVQELVKLPDNQQELLIMRYINGLSYKKIGDIVDKEEGAVRVAVHRAVKNLYSKISSAKTSKK